MDTIFQLVLIFSFFQFFAFSILELFDSRLFDFSTFRLFFFPLDSQRFKIQFKTWKDKKYQKVYFLTFRLFDFSSSLSTLNGLSYNSKSEKSKSILFDFSVFRFFDFSSSLSTLNGLSCNSKSEKSKNILFDFSIFLLFDFSTFRFFDFSTFRLFFFDVSIFRLFFFPLDFERFKLQFKRWKVKKYTFRLFSFSIFRLFDFSSSLSTLNGLSCNSKSEKSKSILFDFSKFKTILFRQEPCTWSFLPSFPHVLLTFDMVTIPCACHAKRHLNVQKWSEHEVLLAFWLGNVLRATTACTFSTSELPKVVSTLCFLHFDFQMCYAPQWRR